MSTVQYKGYDPMDCLDSVEDMIKEHEQLETNLVWNDLDNDPDTGVSLEYVLKNLTRLYDLRLDGVLYEPNF